MKKVYIVRRTSINEIRSNRNTLQQALKISIDCYPWDSGGYRPRVEGIVLNTGTSFYVQLKAYEKEIKATYRQINDDVYKDSCLEFFLNPDPSHGERYMNFEFNPLGTLLLCIGKNRFDRKAITNVSPKLFSINSSLDEESIRDYKDSFWSIEFEIPFDFLEDHYGKMGFNSGSKMSSNFYKCGDETSNPHFGCWNPVTSEYPDFHRPECFGELILE